MPSSRQATLREFCSLLLFGLGFFGAGGAFAGLIWCLTTGRPVALVLALLAAVSLALLFGGRALSLPPRPPPLWTLLCPLQFAPVVLLFQLGRSIVLGTTVEAALVAAAVASVVVAFVLGTTLQRRGLYFPWWR